MRALKLLCASMLSFVAWLLSGGMWIVRTIGAIFAIGIVILVWSMCSDGTISFFPAGLFLLFVAFLMSPFGIPLLGDVIVEFLRNLCDKLLEDKPTVSHKSKANDKKKVKKKITRITIVDNDKDDTGFNPPAIKF